MTQQHRELVENVILVDVPRTRWMQCKAVLGALANLATNEAGIAWPGVELLMRRTGASESVITRTTKLLVEKEWLKRQRRGGTSNVYRLNVNKLAEHQEARPDRSPVAQYLPGLTFGDEKPPAPAPVPHVPGRSTARKRAETPPEQRKPARGGRVSSHRRDVHATSTPPTRQSDEQAVSDLQGSEQASSAPAQPAAPAPPPRRPAPAPAPPPPPEPAPEPTPACLPASRAGKTQGRPRLAAVPDTPGGRFLAQLRLDGGLPVTAQVIRQHHEAITGLLDTWPPDELAAHLRRECQNARNPMGRLVSALRDTQPRLPVQAPSRALPPWCGSDGSDGRDACDERTRQRVSAADGAGYRCPDCHPNRNPASAVPKTHVLGTATPPMTA